MRHLYGLGFGLVLAPVTWFLASLGHFRMLDGAAKLADGGGTAPSHLAFGAVLIIAAGAWLGVLLSSRLSPIAPAITGLLWLGLGFGFVAKGEAFLGKLPDGPSGQEGLFGLPLEHGYAFLIGAALMSPLFSPARWRSVAAASRAADLPAAEEPAEYPTGGYATGSHSTVDAERPVQRRSRPARPVAVPDEPRSLPDERRSATGTYRVVQRPEPEPPMADPPRLSSWNEDGTGQHAVVRHRVQGR